MHETDPEKIHTMKEAAFRYWGSFKLLICDCPADPVPLPHLWAHALSLSGVSGTTFSSKRRRWREPRWVPALSGSTSSPGSTTSPTS